MGAITFSIDPNLVRLLAGEMAFDVFVETGTYHGDTVEHVKALFKQIISIESSASYYQEAVARFQDDASITLVHGDSAETLAELMPRLKRKATLFWLDAHWCVDKNTAGASSQCPLLRELEAIGRLNKKSVILIDDARFFLAPPGRPHTYDQWPTLNEVLRGLRALSAAHELMVVNDVIVYYPQLHREALRAFAHEHGIDWLSVADRSREYPALLQEVENKEAAINDIKAAADERLERLHEMQKDLAAKEAVVHARSHEITAKEEVIQTQHRELAARDEVIANKEAVLQAKDGELAAKDEVIAGKEEVIQTQHRELAARDEMIAGKDAVIQAKDGELVATIGELAAKDEVIAGKEDVIQTQHRDLAARDEVIVGKEAVIKAMEEEVAARDEMVAAKEEVIQTQHRDLADRDEVIAGKEAVLQAKIGELVVTIGELAAKDEVIAGKEAAIKAMEEEVAARDEMVVAKEEVIQTQHRDLAARDEMIAGKEAVLQATIGELVAKDAVIAGKEAVLQATIGELAAKDEVIAGKEAVLQATIGELAAKDEVIAGKEAALQATIGELAAKDEVIAGKEAVLQAMEEEVAARDEMVVAREEMLRAKDGELAAKDEVIVGKDTMIQAREEEVAAKVVELAARDEVIAGKDAMIQAKEEEVVAKVVELAVRDEVIAGKDAVIQAMEGELAAKAEELAAKDAMILAQEATKDRQLAIMELLTYKDQELVAKEEVIQTQHRELIAKEEVLQQLETFRLTSLRYWFSYRLLGFFKRIVRWLFNLFDRPRQAIRAALHPRLGVLDQHPPIPLRLPKRYHTVRCNVETPPTISVVTPSYNHASFLERTIHSVLEQPYPNLEYIVQDGGSTDETDQILERYRAQCSHVASRKDRGQGHAINLGFEHATGEIMAWLNSDDLFLPGALPYVANYFARHPEVDVVYGHRVLIDEQDQEIGRWILPAHDNEILNWADYIPQETMFWRRRIWEEVGGIDESFKFALDWDLLLRFQAAGARIVRLPRFLGAFRIYAEQKTSDWMADVGEQEMNRLRERAHDREVTWQEINERIHPYVRRSTYLHLLYKLRLRRF